MDQAQVVVIGGGITGCSVAYHLAEAGWTDVLLVEKAQLTAGSTCQAAGLVTVFNPSATMMSFRRYSVELYERLGVFDRTGSLRLASSPEQLRELERAASRARGIGLEAEVVSADDAHRLMPAISRDRLYGAVFLAQDGSLDPHTATHAVADAARAPRRPDPDGDPGHRDRARRSPGGPAGADRARPDRDRAGRRCGRDLGAPGRGDGRARSSRRPRSITSTSRCKAVPGHELPRDMPCFRDPDNLVYGKSEHGGMLFGGYEADPATRWIDGVPWDHAAASLPPDYERFAPLMAGAVRRFPFLADAEVIRLVCHPAAADPRTPAAALGPMPGVHGFWVAAGLSLNGFGGGGGIGKAIAGWITADDPGVDVAPYRAWRFADPYRDPTWSAAQAREAYADYYRLRFPYDADEAGRPRRLSPLHRRLQETGATFVAKAGWERADLHRPGEPWRRAGRDQRAYGWTRPPWFERVAVEHRAVRERAGLIDLSSFGKIAVDGPGALGLLQRVCANDVDRPVGSVVYGQFLDPRGGMVADVTVTRLGEESFRVVTGAGYVATEMGWLTANRMDDDPPLTIRDDSEAWACLGLWGPAARRILAAATDDPVDDAALPARRAVAIRIGPAPTIAARISYAGELGWELYVAPDWATQAWDRIVAAGRDHGLEPFGYRALEGLRLEKGYRYYGAELTMLDTPDEAGLGGLVRPAKGPFIGRDAVLAQRAQAPAGPARRLRTRHHRRRRLSADLRRRGGPPGWHGGRAVAQRGLRTQRVTDGRDRVPSVHGR